LTTCPDCHREVSDQAVACPQCGYPVARVHTQPLAPSVPGSAETCKTLDQKLNEAAVMARQRGGTLVVDSRSDTEAIFTFTKTPNHFLHGVLTLITAGLWLIVWLIVAFGGGGRETWRISVGVDGAATVTRV